MQSERPGLCVQGPPGLQQTPLPTCVLQEEATPPPQEGPAAEQAEAKEGGALAARARKSNSERGNLLLVRQLKPSGRWGENMKRVLALGCARVEN